MVKPDDFIEELMSWIGCPFYLNGRSRNGVDCIGLVLKSARTCGLGIGERAEFVKYSQVSSYRMFLEDFKKHCIQYPIEEIAKGDIIHYRGSSGLNHIAVYIEDNKIIGAMDYVGKVTTALEFDRSTVKDGKIWRPKEFTWQH